MRSRAARSRAAAVAVTLFAVLPVAGCYQGSEQTVSSQPPTGNGSDFVVGEDLLVQDATIVTDGSGRGSLLMTITNTGTAADSLVAVGTDPATTPASALPIPVAPGTAVRVGSQATTPFILNQLSVPAGSYITVRFGFERAGSAVGQVLVVPASGYYAASAAAPSGAALQ